MNIDLTHYVILRASRGPWLQAPDAFTSNELRLGDTSDLVTLAGPVRVRVSVQARNFFSMLVTAEVAVQARDVYSYTLDIPPGQMWSYPSPRALEGLISRAAVVTSPALTREAALMDAAGAILPGVAAPAAASTALSDRLVQAVSYLEREPWLGANAGFGIVIRPAGSGPVRGSMRAGSLPSGRSLRTADQGLPLRWRLRQWMQLRLPPGPG